MKKRTQDYTNESITQLEGAERVRRAPGIMFGTEDLQGAFHCVKEIIGNSLDEARGGYGDIIKVKLYKDGSISVADNGRGVPMDYNPKEKRYNWDLVFNELYAGGKYDNKNEAYKYSIGLHGVGATAVQYTSKFFDVTSVRDGYKYHKRFELGSPVGTELEKEPSEEHTGTTIHWLIDDTVFLDTNITFDMIYDYCESQAHLNKVTFEIEDENTGNTVRIEGKGVVNYLEQELGDKVLDTITDASEDSGVVYKGKNKEVKDEYNVKCQVALVFTEETTPIDLFFHNTANILTGRHPEAFNNAITNYLKRTLNNKTIRKQDYKDYISTAITTYSDKTVYSNQVKDGISSQYVYDIIYNTITRLLETEEAKGNEALKTFVENVEDNIAIREKAKIAAENEKIARKTKNRKKKAEKYVDCQSNKPAEKELLIVEGDSALGACKVARDSKFQAILPVRGKTLNCFKVKLETILTNKVINDIITTLGCGVETNTADSSFDIKDLEFNKIIILTDADVDGYQIRVLLYTLFSRLMPELLRKGKVYVGETPLFEIELSKKESLFAYTIEEKDEILSDLKAKGKKYLRVNRSKGLGENNPEMLWNTTLNPETRRLRQLKIDVLEEEIQAFEDMLFGKDKEGKRKTYIYNELETGLENIELEENLVKEFQTDNNLNNI